MFFSIYQMKMAGYLQLNKNQSNVLNPVENVFSGPEAAARAGVFSVVY